jgi:hypothetical protein
MSDRSVALMLKSKLAVNAHKKDRTGDLQYSIFILISRDKASCPRSPTWELTADSLGNLSDRFLVCTYHDGVSNLWCRGFVTAAMSVQPA